MCRQQPPCSIGNVNEDRERLCEHRPVVVLERRDEAFGVNFREIAAVSRPLVAGDAHEFASDSGFDERDVNSQAASPGVIEQIHHDLPDVKRLDARPGIWRYAVGRSMATRPPELSKALVRLDIEDS